MKRRMKQIVNDVLDYLKTQKTPVTISAIQKACKLNWQSVKDAITIIDMVQESWFMDTIEGVRGKEYILKPPWNDHGYKPSTGSHTFPKIDHDKTIVMTVNQSVQNVEK